ncbi:MAG: heavy-metal-associated domain-containing protein [Anaerolineae bacterium]
MENLALGIPGLDNRGAQALKKRLERLEGVQEVVLWPNEDQIVVRFEPERINEQSVKDTILQMGYLAEHINWSERWPG